MSTLPAGRAVRSHDAVTRGDTHGAGGPWPGQPATAITWSVGKRGVWAGPAWAGSWIPSRTTRQGVTDVAQQAAQLVPGERHLDRAAQRQQVDAVFGGGEPERVERLASAQPVAGVVARAVQHRVRRGSVVPGPGSKRAGSPEVAFGDGSSRGRLRSSMPVPAGPSPPTQAAVSAPSRSSTLCVFSACSTSTASSMNWSRVSGCSRAPACSLTAAKASRTAGATGSSPTVHRRGESRGLRSLQERSLGLGVLCHGSMLAPCGPIRKRPTTLPAAPIAARSRCRPPPWSATFRRDRPRPDR